MVLSASRRGQIVLSSATGSDYPVCDACSVFSAAQHDINIDLAARIFGVPRICAFAKTLLL
jgi:hypothetical protein